MAILGVGNIIQVVYWNSATATNVTSTGEWTISASQSPSLTTKGLNSNFIYCCTLGAESDLSTGTNAFFRLTVSTNNFSSSDYVSSGHALVAGTTQNDQSGTNDHTITASHTASYAVGTNVRFRLNFIKSQNASYQFNQQNLGGQPSGTGNYAYGHVMEIGA